MSKLKNLLALVVFSYVLNPERLRAIIERLEEAIVFVLVESGRALIAMIPPQLLELAEQIGRFIEQVGILLHNFIHHVVIPVALFIRKLAIAGVAVVLVVKIAQLGYQIVGVVWHKLPPSAVQHAQDLLNPPNLVSSTLTNEFVVYLLRCTPVFLIPLLPRPRNISELAQFYLRICYSLAIYMLFIGDHATIMSRLSTKLLEIPEISQLISSVVGRYCCIAVTGYVASREKTLSAYVPYFYFLCALFRVYQLAYIATPNFI